MAIIAQTQRSETEYRRLDIDSSSSLKDFADDRKKYYKKHIVGEIVEEEDSKAINMGRIAETILFEEEKFDDKFMMSICSEKPTGLMLTFCHNLCKQTISKLDEEGNLTAPFAEISQRAYDETGYKRSLDWVISNFHDGEPEKYYTELLATKASGKTIITAEDREMGERIARRIRTTEYIQQYITKPKNGEIFYQFQVEGFDIDGLSMKGMFDVFILDHDKKTAYVNDLKCTWSVEDFYKNYYLYRKTYIQTYTYTLAARDWLDKNGYSDYSLNPITYIVCDSSDYYNPLVYQTTVADLMEGYTGFTFENKYYVGVKDIVEGLKWAKETNEWRISKKNYISNGIVSLKP